MIKFVSDKNFNEMLSGAKPVVLVDFFATWCGPCKMLGKELELLAEDMPELDIFKIDTDQCPELSQKFNIDAVPTMIVFKDRKAMARTEGYLPAATLKSKLEGFFR